MIKKFHWVPQSKFNPLLPMIKPKSDWRSNFKSFEALHHLNPTIISFSNIKTKSSQLKHVTNNSILKSHFLRIIHRQKKNGIDSSPSSTRLSITERCVILRQFNTRWNGSKVSRNRLQDSHPHHQFIFSTATCFLIFLFSHSSLDCVYTVDVWQR